MKMEENKTCVSDQSLISGDGILQGREAYHLDSFGENVCFFSSEDDPFAVQQLMKLWERQETNQFGDARWLGDDRNHNATCNF